MKLDRKSVCTRNHFMSARREDVWTLINALMVLPEYRNISMASCYAVGVAVKEWNRKEKDLCSHSIDSNLLLEDLLEYESYADVMDDFLPRSSWEFVDVRIGKTIYKMLAGLTERPVNDIYRLIEISEVFDDLIVPKLGYGILDVAKICLKYMTYCHDNLLLKFYGRIGLAEDVPISQEDFDLVAEFLEIDPLENLDLSEKELHALKALTIASERVSPESMVRPETPMAWLRVKKRGKREYRWIPPTLVPDLVSTIATNLVATAFRQDIAQVRMKKYASERVLSALRQLGAVHFGDTAYAAAEESANEVLIQVDRARCIAVSIQICGDIDYDSMTDIENWGPLSSHETTEAYSLRHDDVANVTHKLETEIISLTVVAAPAHIAFPGDFGCEIMSLEDFEWICGDADSSRDLFRFLREARRASNMFGWEKIDFWEAWKSNHQSFSRGISADFVSIAPHASELEWKKFRDVEGVEKILCDAGLDGLRLATRFEGLSEGDRVAIQYQNDSSHYRYLEVLLSDPPVIIALPSDLSPTHLDEFYPYMQAFTVGIQRASEAWTERNKATGTITYVLEPNVNEGSTYEITTVSGGEPIADVRTLHGYVCIPKEKLSAFQIDTPVSSIFAPLLIDLAAHAGWHDLLIANLRQEFDLASPFLAVGELGDRASLRAEMFLQIPPAEESEVLKKLAWELENAHVRPGTFDAQETLDIMRESIAPILLSLLRAEIEKFTSGSIKEFGLIQLSRCSQYRERNRIQGALEYRNFHYENGVTILDRISKQSFQERKCRGSNELLVELSVSCSSQGISKSQNLLDFDWERLLALADSYLTVTRHIESNYYRINPVVLVIAENFELSIHVPEEPTCGGWQINIDAMNDAQSKTIVGAHGWSLEVQTLEFCDDTVQAFSAIYGCEPNDVVRALGVLMKCRSKTLESPVVRITKSDLESMFGIELGTSSSKRISSVIDCLTTTSDKHSLEKWEPWKTRSRRNRLITQPIVALDGDSFCFSPLYVRESFGVYVLYMNQGGLPWSADVPQRLLDSLVKDRQKRNRMFEDDLQCFFTNEGFLVKKNIKKRNARSLGIQSLRSEIDLLAVRVDPPEVHLIEAKDPISVHGTAETARNLKDFFGELDGGGSKRSYSDKLREKLEDISPFTTEIYQNISGRVPNEDVHLKVYMVTRASVPANYTDSEFVVLPLSALRENTRKVER